MSSMPACAIQQDLVSKLLCKYKIVNKIVLQPGPGPRYDSGPTIQPGLMALILLVPSPP
jgi:hypothetical protein